MKTFTYTWLIGTLLTLSCGCAAVTDQGEAGELEDGLDEANSEDMTPPPSDGAGGTDATATGGAPSEPPAPAAGGTPTVPLPPVDNGTPKSCLSSGSPGDVLLFDDFEDGAATWFANEEIFWELTADETQVYQQAYPADDLIVAAGGCNEWSDVMVEARVKMTAGSDSEDVAAIFVRLENENNFYYVAFQGDGTLKLKKRSDGSNNSIGTTYSDTVLEQNVWYTLGIEAVGPQLNMYLDGVLVDRVDEPGKFSATDTDLTAGLAGFGTLGNATAMFDDVTVTQR